jgi:hypothetical protein
VALSSQNLGRSGFPRSGKSFTRSAIRKRSVAGRRVPKGQVVGERLKTTTCRL